MTHPWQAVTIVGSRPGAWLQHEPIATRHLQSRGGPDRTLDKGVVAVWIRVSLYYARAISKVGRAEEGTLDALFEIDIESRAGGW